MALAGELLCADSFFLGSCGKGPVNRRDGQATQTQKIQLILFRRSLQPSNSRWLRWRSA